MAGNESTAIHDLIRDVSTRPLAGVVRDSEVTMIAQPRPRPAPEPMAPPMYAAPSYPAPAYAAPYAVPAATAPVYAAPIYYAPPPTFDWRAHFASYMPRADGPLTTRAMAGIASMAIAIGVFVGILVSI